MPIVIEPYRQEHEPAVAEFNQRLRAAGADQDFVFYPWATPRWLPPSGNSPLNNKFFLALDGKTVRGGYALKHQDFLFPDGTVRNVAYYHHPLSEGIVDKAHAIVGTLLLRDALNRSPLLYCLGMGGYQNPLAQMLVRLGWSHCPIPFWFHVVRPSRFLRQMQAARTSPLRRLGMDFAAFSGLGWVASKVFNVARSAGRTDYQFEPIAEFSGWTDALWAAAKDSYTLTAVRDCATLVSLFSPDQTHLTRLRVTRNGSELGWAVVGEKRRDAKYGEMRVGSIVDCWASPENALPVVRAAADALKQKGMDLIISNQSHTSWCRALAESAFLQAQSNFVFAASKKFSELIRPFDENKCRMHFTRADGDGLPHNY